MDYVDVLSSSIVSRKDISLYDSYEEFLELKVYGPKVVLDTFFVNYDEGDSGKIRKLYRNRRFRRFYSF